MASRGFWVFPDYYRATRGGCNPYYTPPAIAITVSIKPTDPATRVSFVGPPDVLGCSSLSHHLVTVITGRRKFLLTSSQKGTQLPSTSLSEEQFQNVVPTL